MSEAEAIRLGVPPHQVRSYFRADDAKSNLAPLSGAQWYEKMPVRLANDEFVAAITRWEPQQPEEIFRPEHLALLRERLAETPSRFSPQAANWVGHALAEIAGLTPGVNGQKRLISEQVETWLRDGALKKVYAPDEHRKSVPFVVPGDCGTCGTDIQQKSRTGAEAHCGTAGLAGPR